MSIALPLTDVSKFGDLFLYLENHLAELGIGSFGVSLTSLEEV